MSAKPQISSEDVLNQKIDLCISNTICLLYTSDAADE